MMKRRGAAAIEYALLLSLRAIAVIAGVQKLQAAIGGASSRISNAAGGHLDDVQVEKKPPRKHAIDDW